jgi:hypothetical protein
VLYIETLFDSHVDPRPLVTGFLNSSNPNDVGTIDLWLPGTRSVLQAEEMTNRFLRDVIMDGSEFSINDWKSHIVALGLPAWRYNVRCRAPSTIQSSGSNQELVRKRLIEAHRNGCHRWEEILAKAHMAYAHLERVGISNGIEMVRPIYSTDTWSGRSKTTGFVIQGQNEDSVVLPTREGHRWFLHFDWTAADARIASILSGDPEMDAAFIKGEDPYAVVLRKKRAQGIFEERDHVKREWLRVLYSMDVEAPIVSYFPKMKAWMLAQVSQLKKHGWLESILGRRFRVAEHKEGGEKGERAVFNAVLQGSVAHAMHATLAAVTERFPDNVFAEIHDSLVMTCKDSDLDDLIKGVREIMTRPFAGILDSNPLFPVKVSLGKQWKRWVPLEGR